MSSARNAATNDVYSDHKATKGTPMPRWLPVSLLALSTAALAVPIVLLRRQQKSILTRSLKNAPAPPRRSATALPPTGRASTSAAAFSSGHSYPRVEPSSPTQSTSSTNAAAEDDFNGALYCMKAFGYATAMVFVGAIAAVWGVKTYMGVEDTQEFARRMRLAVVTHMPKLSARIHRMVEGDDGIPGTYNDGEDIDPATWTWQDAERRLTAAFEKDGFSGWAAAAARELEAEGRVERLKRNHTYDSGH